MLGHDGDGGEYAYLALQPISLWLSMLLLALVLVLLLFDDDLRDREQSDQEQ